MCAFNTRKSNNYCVNLDLDDSEKYYNDENYRKEINSTYERIELSFYQKNKHDEFRRCIENYACHYHIYKIKLKHIMILE